MRLGLVAIALVLGCGGGAASTTTVDPMPLPDDEPTTEPSAFDNEDPAPPRELTPEELEPIMKRWHVSMTSLGDVFTASAGDCAQLAANLDAWAIESQSSLAELASDIAAIPDAQWEELVAARAEAEPELLRPLQAGYLSCSEHPDFHAVTERIDALVY